MSHVCDNCGNHVTDPNTTNNALVKCAKIIAAHIDVNSTVEKLLEVMCEFNQAEFAFIYEKDYTTEKNELSHVYLSDKADVDFMTFKSVSFDDRSALSKILDEKPYLFLQHSDAENEVYQPCKEHLSADASNNMLIIPLNVRGRVVGVVGCINLGRHSEGFELCIAVSNFLSSSISIKYSKDSLVEKERELAELQSLSDTLMAAIDTLGVKCYEESIDKLLDLVCRHFNADRAYSFELDMANKTFINNYEILNGASESCVTNLDEVPFDIAFGWVSTLKENELFYKKIYDMDTSNEEYKFLLSENIIDLALLPLVFDGEVIGAIGIDNPKSSVHNFDLLRAASELITNNIKRK